MKNLFLRSVQLVALIFIVFFCASLSYAFEWVPKAPSLTARNYILIDFYSNKVLAEKNADQKVDPASLTKLMTAYLVYQAIENDLIAIDDQVKISQKAGRTVGSRMFIEIGSLVSVSDLLAGVVIQSGNDASVALAEHVAGNEEVFADLMNRKAQELGLSSSYFVNATGLSDDNHYMSARDIAVLSQALIRDYPKHYDLYSILEYTYNNIRQPNRNVLLTLNMNVDGLKTGYTKKAGYCLVVSSEQDGMRLIAVIMGSGQQKRFDEASQLLRYGYRFYETAKLFGKQETLTEVRVWGGDKQQLGLGVSEDIYITMPRNRNASVNTELMVYEDIIAPVEKGQELGSITISFGDKTIEQSALISLHRIAKGNLWSRLSDSIIHLFQ
ncbi:MAG: D-alanyl-D-alanine carboxypeptidase [Chromatiales bacterium]|nr:D-alanyl-D-alanine carboxypeptidase [Chromatiales bacterium]